MAAIGAIGYGAELRVGATTSATTATILLAGITSCPPPPFSRDLVDVTHMASPNATREFIPALSDPGEVSFELNWVPGNAADAVFDEMKGETDARIFTITFTQVSPAAVCTFYGFLTGYEPGVPLEDKMTASVTLKVTGAPEWS